MAVKVQEFLNAGPIPLLPGTQTRVVGERSSEFNHLLNRCRASFRLKTHKEYRTQREINVLAFAK